MIEIKVGDFVYEAYNPRKGGKVLKTGLTFKSKIESIPFIPEMERNDGVEVKWLDGKTEIVCVFSLNKIQDLIDDHKKKLAKHEALLEKVKKI